MADTVLVNIPGGNQWTQVAATSGRITTSDPCFYCKSSSTPFPTLFGHRLDEGDTLDFSLESSERLYLKSDVSFRATVSQGGFGANGVWPYNDWFGLMTQGQKAVVFQNYTEANVKNGVQYYCRALFPAVGVGTTVQFSFQTGVKPVVIKSREVNFDGSSRVDYVALEGGTATGGAAVEVGNENRINPVPTTVTLKQGVSLSGGVTFRTKTIFGSGSTSGGGSRVGTDVLGRETVLKPNTLYQVKLTNTAGSTANIQLELSWYEGTLDLPA
ncbi:hypothetical protein KLEA5_gp10 [Aeromonas phage vB_AveS_KLEA5]|nr:hypothetical protein KLEA5_gp10 [Aeromonas phage vB_AveS_KLEA5]